jgi:hypothetical protein
MKKAIRLLAIAMLALGLAVTAQAQASRTWVSGVGDDANPCSRTAPCKTFAGAISKTAAGGEISVLDPGSFGQITITKSMTIDGRGQLAAILVSSGSGIIVNAALTDKVHIRNISINGANTVGATTGVRVTAAAQVVIENVSISNLRGGALNSRGIVITAAAASPHVTRVNVVNTTIRNSSNFGIASEPTGTGTVNLTVEGCRILDNDFSAIDLDRNTKATIVNSVMTNNSGGAGVFAEQATVEANIYNSVLSNNAFGVFSGNGGAPMVRLFGSQVTGNTTAGLNIVSGTVESHGNNAIRGNVGNQTPSGASVNTQ